MSKFRVLSFVAMGMAGSAVSVANAQPFLVNGSGATLFQNFFNAPASTNDYIDVDGDSAPVPDQLAPDSTTPSPPWPASMHWQVTYRVVGSVNGFAELRDWGTTFSTFADGSTSNGTFNGSFSDQSIWNRATFITTGLPTGAGLYNPANAGGTPVRSLTNGTFLATDSTGPGTGLRIDFAAIDVPVSWSVIYTGGAGPVRVPGTPGYGDNPITALNKDGSPAIDPVTLMPQSNKLETLVGLNGTINTNVANPNANTVFDTSIALAPVAAMVNYGAGLQQIKMSDLRHLSATGRRINGENLMKVCRDSGSGTRNAFMNGIALDPSWGRGENVGPRTVSSSNDLLGPNFTPSNKGASGRVEATVKNHRLSIGHSGAERGINSGWLGTQADVLAVQSDIKGGTVFARPTIAAVLDGGANGYNIVGPGVLATMGDARSAPASLGGWGWAPGETGPYPNPVQPPANPQASAYVNNITRSIAAFSALPGGGPTVFSPGEYLAANYLLSGAATNVPLNNPPSGAPFIPIVPNGTLNTNLQNFIAGISTLANPAYATYKADGNGLVPARTAGVLYSDQSAPGATPDKYVTQGGTPVTYGSALTSRNRISGDFNGDGARTSADVTEMMKAYRSRNGGPAWVAPTGTGPIAGAPGTDAIIEVIGDFNGDGSFTAADVRYWADGLCLNASGTVDRDLGFTLVDNAWQSLTGSSNFFGATWASGASYVAGDSRFDVSNADVTAGTESVTVGFAPSGADNVIDQDDADYIMAQYTGNPYVTDGEATWSDLDEAVGFDLSADTNGDLVVNSLDLGALAGCYADCDNSGTLDFFDFLCFQNAFAAGNASADCDNSGSLDFFDFLCFQNEFNLGCP